MDDDVHPDLGIPIEVIHACLSRLVTWYLGENNSDMIRRIVDLCLFLSIGYITVLRGGEVVKLDQYNLKLHSDNAMNDNHLFMPTPLLGKLNCETITRYHTLPIAFKTRSSIKNDICTVCIFKERRKAGWLFTTNNDKHM